MSRQSQEDATVLLAMMLLVAVLSFAAGYMYHGHREQVRRTEAARLLP
jgi:uncharacterized protein HemX